MDPTPFEPVWRHPVLFTILAVFGACVGSFLNVVIYRLPRGLAVNEPRRSFCPSCRNQIPWYRNLPVISWLALRGHCAECGASISARYLVVEMLTAVLFVLVWAETSVYGWGVGLMALALVSLLIAASFIDYEHYIIPDSLTWGGAGAGLVLAGLVPLIALGLPRAGILVADGFSPGMVPQPVWWRSLLASLLGGACGYGLLWSVVQLGKLAFGRRVHEFDEELPWKIHEPDPESEPQLEIGGDVYLWSELFSRPTDQLVIESAEVALDGETRATDRARFFFDRLVLGDETLPLEQLQVVSGRTRRIVQPREAMGFGDVKFVAMIGTFLGWQATGFTLIGGAVLGSVGGVLQKYLGGDKWAKPIPFGPYLALAALVFLLSGQELIGWYLRLAGLR